MTSGAEPRRSDAEGDNVKGQCLKCSYPLAAESNVLSVISRFKEMLQHVGYLTGRLVMDEETPGSISISLTIRRVQHPAPSAGKPVEETPPGPRRTVTLGTSSCCSTNSLCKAHTCGHQTSKPAPAPVRVPATDIPYQGQEQPEGAQFGGDQAPGALPGDRQGQGQGARQTQMHQPQQKMEAEQSGLHRLQGVGGSMPLLAHTPHLNTQKQHGGTHQDDAQLRSSGQHVGMMSNAVGDGHNDKSKKQNVQLGGAAHMRDGERQGHQAHQGHQDQSMVPSQQPRLHWAASAERLGTAVELPFQRGMQGRNFPRQVHNPRGLHQGHVHPGMPQSGDGLSHDITRGLPSDLQLMEQSPDGYAPMSLTDEHMHGSSGTVTPVQRRIQMQQPDQWAMPGRGDSGIETTERDTEGNRLSGAGDDARSVAGASLTRRIDYNGVRTGQSPPAKRARIPHGAGGSHGMIRLPNEGTSGAGSAVNTSAGGIDLQSGALVSTGSVGLQAGALGNSAMVNAGPVSEHFQCDQCGKTFGSETDMQKHTLKEHRTPAPRDEHGRYPCTMPTCTLSFVRRHVMERHVRTVHLKIREFPCDACGRKFADSSTREVHRSAVHEKKKPWTCDICLANFTQSSSLGKHKRRFHEKSKGETTAAQ